MEFIVPKFIEREPKVVGPFTFKQFIIIGIACGFSVFLYFVLPFSLFFIVAIVLFGGAFVLVFLKINGISLPVVIKNFLIFLGQPKIYLWNKKIVMPKIYQKPKETKEESTEKLTFKAEGSDRLRELATKLETKTK